MSERLSDEQVARIATEKVSPYTHPGSLGRIELAREVQEWRTLIFGGPCPTCEGFGAILTGEDMADPPCPNPDCKNGRLPGLADRLEAPPGEYLYLCTEGHHSTSSRELVPDSDDEAPCPVPNCPGRIGDSQFRVWQVEKRDAAVIAALKEATA